MIVIGGRLVCKEQIDAIWTLDARINTRAVSLTVYDHTHCQAALNNRTVATSRCMTGDGDHGVIRSNNIMNKSECMELKQCSMMMMVLVVVRESILHRLKVLLP